MPRGVGSTGATPKAASTLRNNLQDASFQAGHLNDLVLVPLLRAAIHDGRYLRRRFPEAPCVIVFVDEIEKAFAGAGADISGAKTEMSGTMMGLTQDLGADGLTLSQY